MPVSRKDFPKIAEFITDEYSRRKRSRGDLEKIMAVRDDALKAAFYAVMMKRYASTETAKMTHHMPAAMRF